MNYGGYGSYSRLSLGNNFGTKWEVSGLDAPANKRFTEVNVSFGAGLDTAKQKSIAEYIVKQGGLIVKEDEGKCDLFILAVPTVDEQNTVEPKGFLTVEVEEFLEVIPAIKSPRPKTPKSAQLSDELKQLQKQLLERNHDSIRTALKALEGRDEEIDLLIQGVSVNPGTGELDRGPQFKGSGPAMRFLDFALMGLLSQAGENSHASKIRSEIKKLKFEIKELPRLFGFTALEDLEVIFKHVKDDEQTEIIKDLGAFGEMKKLRRLRIKNDPHKTSYEGIYPLRSGEPAEPAQIKSLAGLNAPLLEELEAIGIGLLCIESLVGCSQLKTIDLSRNADLTDISALTGCSTIEMLKLNNTGIASVEPLATAKGLTKLNIEGCRNLKSFKGLNANQLDTVELVDLDVTSLDGLESLTNLRKLELRNLHKLQCLDTITNLYKLEELVLTKLNSIKELPSLEKLAVLKSVRIFDCDNLTDISSMESANSLTTFSIDRCCKINTGPVRWPNELQSLRLNNTKLFEIGVCPHTLTELKITSNGNIKNLDGLTKCTNLEISNCFDLTGCFKIKNLNGLTIPKLEAIRIPETLNNLDALKRYPDIAITIVISPRFDQIDKTDEDITPALADALLALGTTHLAVKTQKHGYLRDITGICKVSTLTSLDLSDCDLVDISGIVGLNKLELLMVKPRTELSKSLGKATFEGKAQINKLRLKILAGL